MSNLSDRRNFLKTAAVAGAGTLLVANAAHAAQNDVIKVGIVGCGGRGTGAGTDVLRAAPGVKIVALGDAFGDRLTGCLNRLTKDVEDAEVKKFENTVDVPKERQFVGLDAYDKVINCPDVNYVILATPPGFRPTHIAATIAAGKNLFTEKPVAVDGPGIRKVLAAYDEAKKKNLGIAAGTQRRHQTGYVEMMKRVHNGEIGELVTARCFWNQGILWKVPRTRDMSDLQWQMRNWYNFTWLCGDHIVEQHVHNIDVCNWAFKGHPVKAVGMGGRSRNNPDFGHIFDFFAVDFEYPDSRHMLSMCRQIDGCANSVSEHLVGTKGTTYSDGGRQQINGKSVLERGKDNRPYIQEHTDLIASLREGPRINELKNVAESTLTAIMGRMSAYTGEAITWEQALNSKEDTMPEKLTWDMKLDVPAVAVPGKTRYM